MKTQGIYEIVSNRPIAQDTFEMVLKGDMSFVEAPGQFVNIKIEGLYLRRPISICDWDEKTMTLIYKMVGRGTERMAAMEPGEELDLLVGLGNGFNMEETGEKTAIIGGGVGAPPMYGLAKRMIAAGKKITVVLGFGNADQAFYVDRFEALGCPVYVTTVDGSQGIQGFVTDALEQIDYDAYCACGPMPMLKAVWGMGKEGQLSFEERMGCGFGACMGCSCETLTGNKRICVEGPVMKSSEVKF